MGDMWYCPQPAIGQIQKKNRINFLWFFLKWKVHILYWPVKIYIYRCTTVVKYIVHLSGVDELWPKTWVRRAQVSCAAVSGIPAGEWLEDHAWFSVLHVNSSDDWNGKNMRLVSNFPIGIKTIEYIRYRYRCMSYILELINIHIISILYIHVWSHRG